MTFGIWLLRKLWTVVKGRQQLLFACLLHLSVCVSKKIHSVLEVIQIFVIFFKNSIQTDYLSFWQGVSNDKSLLENYINKEHSHKHAYRYAMEFSPLVRYICVIHVLIWHLQNWCSILGVGIFTYEFLSPSKLPYFLVLPLSNELPPLSITCLLKPEVFL